MLLAAASHLVPLMFHEIVEMRSWIDAQTFLNGIALGHITPGPIVITATFVGYIVYGLLGAIVATVSVFLPSFMIVVGVVPYFDRLRNSIYFRQSYPRYLVFLCWASTYGDVSFCVEYSVGCSSRFACCFCIGRAAFQSRDYLDRFGWEP